MRTIPGNSQILYLQYDVYLISMSTPMNTLE
jgi:hypothetical protein